MLSSALQRPWFVQLAPLEMNTEIFDPGDHGYEKIRATNEKTLGQLPVGTPQHATGEWIALNSGSRERVQREMGMVFGSLGFKTWHFLDRVRRFLICSM